MAADPVSALPILDGLDVRPVTMDDAADAVALFNRCDGRFAGERWHSVEDLRLIWNDPVFDVSRDTLGVFERSGRLIAYEQAWSEPPFVRNRLFGRVDPDHEERGIGTALFEWGERLARDRFPRAPDDAQIRLQAWGFAGHEPTSRLLGDHGMTLERCALDMAMDLAPAPAPKDTAAQAWPPGVELRPYRAEQLRQLFYAHHEAFRDHSGSAETDVEAELARFRQVMQKDDGYDPALWFVAWDGEEIAGFALCRFAAHSDADMAWVDDLGVRRPWRRKGLAMALLNHAIGVFRERGRPRIGLSVDAQSLTGATRLYEKVGMSVTHTIEVYQRRDRAGRDYETTSVDD